MTGSYLLELSRWNVKNDGTNAVTTSAGINNALSWAATEGFAELVLPNGVYLIDENNPIIPQSFLTLNLGGATLRIRDNSLPKYAIILIANEQRNLRITNGKIEGDRYTHSYVGGSTHEFGVGIQLREDVQFITIDNLEIFNTTGDAVNGITSFGSLGAAYPKLQGNFEKGGIDTATGEPTNNLNRIRSTVDYPIVQQILNTGYFGIYGDSFGIIGNDITTNTYDVIFYNSNYQFVQSTVNLRFFDEVVPPPTASYAKIVLHQSSIPSTNENKLTIRTPKFPSHIYIDNCDIHHCRRLGIAICGIKHCVVKRNKIHNIGGTAPACGIDIEDGYEINQYIHINDNNIYSNERYNIIVVAGKHINITNNKLKSGIFTINSRAKKINVQENHFLDTTPLLAGNILFSNNFLTSCRVRLLESESIIISNCFFHNTPINFNKQKSYVAKVNDCKFIFDNDFLISTINPGAPIIFSKEPQTIENCTFDGNGIEAFTVVPAGAYNWILNNVAFINIKHTSNRITRLPPGFYTNCSFKNCGILGEIFNGENANYEFHGSQFEWSSHILFNLGQGTGTKNIKFDNCLFSNSNGLENAFLINGTFNDLTFTNNTFSYKNSNQTPMIDIRPAAALQSLRISNNAFHSNGMISVRSSSSPAFPIIFSDNILSSTTYQLHNSHIIFDNIVDGKKTS
ncbi:right-handed parallel beta-helix repeat-containing protein [Cytobacillus horneckiae]|uniref:right-handed parallel beta-helix repeat-containing protein n=1 Tax=Cytobacillus horneckiae TaxID=549687 RepID=UPI0039A23B7E